MDTSDVSIILRVKNGEKHLEEAIGTIRSTAPDVEVVVVNNESTDETGSIAARLADVVLTHVGALGDCRRPGVDRASGAVAFFMDVDQRLLPGTVASARRALEAHEAIVVPERPAQRQSFWTSILATERNWAEASGLGCPRVFWRQRYMAYKEPLGLFLGEDVFIARQVSDVGLSSVPILHHEPPSAAALLTKYHSYGMRHSGSKNNYYPLLRTLRSSAAGIRFLPMSSLHLVPLVVLLKLAKASAYYSGVRRAPNRRRLRRAPASR